MHPGISMLGFFLNFKTQNKMKITKQIAIPKEWTSLDDRIIILQVTADIINHDGRIIPVIEQIICKGYQMWLINTVNYFDVVGFIDKEIIDEYANIKLSNEGVIDNGE